MKYYLPLASAAVLAACSSEAPEPTPEPAAPAPEVVERVQRAPTLSSGTILPITNINTLSVPDTLLVEQSPDGSVVLSGEDLSLNSTGTTSGVTIELTKEQEAMASGNSVRVTVLGKSLTETEAPLKVAYSTADVGNSGWNALVFGTDWTEQSFVYAVPEINSGNGDFIGLSPIGIDVAIASASLEFLD